MVDKLKQGQKLATEGKVSELSDLILAAKTTKNQGLAADLGCLIETAIAHKELKQGKVDFRKPKKF